ncbi:serine protease, partial [Escherichia coli]|nr:serine protease [Escherichia coli]
MTNQHVVGPSQYISVQFDSKRKIPAVLLAASPEKDIAILWANLEALPDATPAPIAKLDSS